MSVSDDMVTLSVRMDPEIRQRIYGSLVERGQIKTGFIFMFTWLCEVIEADPTFRRLMMDGRISPVELVKEGQRILEREK